MTSCPRTEDSQDVGLLVLKLGKFQANRVGHSRKRESSITMMGVVWQVGAGVRHFS